MKHVSMLEFRKNALAVQGRYEAAIPRYERELELRPDWTRSSRSSATTGHGRKWSYSMPPCENPRPLGNGPASVLPNLSLRQRNGASRPSVPASLPKQCSLR